MELMELPEQLKTAGIWKGRPNGGEIALSRHSCSEENERRTGGKVTLLRWCLSAIGLSCSCQSFGDRSFYFDEALARTSVYLLDYVQSYLGGFQFRR
jgi:hypothetical protein